MHKATPNVQNNKPPRTRSPTPPSRPNLGTASRLGVHASLFMLLSASRTQYQSPLMRSEPNDMSAPILGVLSIGGPSSRVKLPTHVLLLRHTP